MVIIILMHVYVNIRNGKPPKVLTLLPNKCFIILNTYHYTHIIIIIIIIIFYKPMDVICINYLNFKL